jgi:hypothetical protein
MRHGASRRTANLNGWKIPEPEEDAAHGPAHGVYPQTQNLKVICRARRGSLIRNVLTLDVGFRDDLLCRPPVLR